MVAQSIGFSAEPSAIGIAAVLLLILLVVLWFVVASAAALKGDAMDNPNRMAQLYGYTVCLVAVILALTSLSSIVEAVFERAHPLQSEFGYGASLVSFEAYKATLPRERAMMSGGSTQVPDTASDATLRERYEALVADRKAAMTYGTSKKFFTSGILLAVAVALFLVHWRWLGRMRGPAPGDV